MSKSGKRIIKILSLTILSFAIATAIAFVCLTAFIYKDINFEADEILFEGARSFNSTTFYADASDDMEDSPVAVEISGNMRKIHYSLDEMSKYLKDGFIAVEDKKFYSHSGFDLRRTIFATVNYIFGKDRIFGASTITQQVVKNISGDNQLTIKRKIGEIIRAWHIERSYSKDEIFEVYLNVIPMSENIYGIGAASRAYFGKEPSELLIEEAATLIGITNAPTAYNPYLNPDACKRKRNIVLSVMRDDGIITEEEYLGAVETEIRVIPREEREYSISSWFIETVIDDLANDFALKYEISTSAARLMLLGGGYKVYTTMNIDVQNALEEYFSNKDNFPYEVNNGLNYAMSVTDSSSGYLVGIVGRVGDKNGNRLLNHALVPHIPGSTLKPIALYAPLIDEGRINWATVFDDVPVEFIEEDGGYREYPRNSPAIYDGLTTVKDALRNSKNTIAVKLCQLRGEQKIFNSLKNDFGFDTLIERDGGVTDVAVAPMALGQLGRGVSLRKMTESFGTFPSDGVFKESISYLKVEDHNGKIVFENNQRQKRIFSKETSRIMTQMLLTVTDSGTASKIRLKDMVETAGKTGTSSGNRDKMFVGYTPYFTAGIWCGYDKSDVSIPTLSRGHLQIWDDVMTIIHSEIIEEGNVKGFSTEGLYHLPYCMDSGQMYSDTCLFDPRGNRCEYGYFTADNQPKRRCDRHVLCRYDSVTKSIAFVDCPDENIIEVALIRIDDRAFPKEIEITDAEFVYRDIDGYTQRPLDESLPYFQYCLPPDVFVGRSKGKKQFNSNCTEHYH